MFEDNLLSGLYIGSHTEKGNRQLGEIINLSDPKGELAKEIIEIHSLRESRREAKLTIAQS